MIKKFIKRFRTNSIIVTIESIFVDEKNIYLSTNFPIQTLDFDNYFFASHMVLFFNFFNFVYLFICKLFFDMSRKIKENSFYKAELIRQRREQLKFRISKQLIN